MSSEAGPAPADVGARTWRGSIGRPQRIHEAGEHVVMHSPPLTAGDEGAVVFVAASASILREPGTSTVELVLRAELQTGAELPPRCIPVAELSLHGTPEIRIAIGRHLLRPGESCPYSCAVELAGAEPAALLDTLRMVVGLLSPGDAGELERKVAAVATAAERAVGGEQ